MSTQQHQGRRPLRSSCVSVYVAAAFVLWAGVAGAVPLRAQVQASQPIRIGQVVAGSLTASDHILSDGSFYDLYRFQAARGERFVITLRSEDFDAYLALARSGSDGFDALVSDDDSGGGTDARITWSAPAEGTYLIRANSLRSGETGTYRLTLEVGDRVAPISLESVTPIGFGQNLEGTLRASDPVLDDGAHYRLYRFVAAAGDRVVITLRSDDFDAYLHLGWLDEGQFAELETDDDSGGGMDSRIEWAAPGSGTYLLQVSTFSDGETGSYTLSLERGARR
jgi:predicted small integral membrane protein